ncbi:hypothetical protein [Ethanoligenens sp.]|uniref:hypothetical protein n=1 Tax=Ethanoligenens sp. TaxID=2099655 RepID=UPI0039EAE659
MADRIQTNAQALESTAAQTPVTDNEKQFTQADLDTAIEKRLLREHRKWQREQADTSTDPTTGKSDSLLEAANHRHLLAEAKLAAVTLGVPAKRAGYAARLADLTGVDIDEENGPDTAAVQKAVETVLRDIPELKAAPQDPKRAGMRIGANSTPVKPGSVPEASASRMKPWNKFRI